MGRKLIFWGAKKQHSDELPVLEPRAVTAAYMFRKKKADKGEADKIFDEGSKRVDALAGDLDNAADAAERGAGQLQDGIAKAASSAKSSAKNGITDLKQKVSGARASASSAFAGLASSLSTGKKDKAQSASISNSTVVSSSEVLSEDELKQMKKYSKRYSLTSSNKKKETAKIDSAAVLGAFSAEARRHESEKNAQKNGILARARAAGEAKVNAHRSFLSEKVRR